MATARDGLVASCIARTATEQAIGERAQPSLEHPASEMRADMHGSSPEIPLDTVDLPAWPASNSANDST